MSGAETRLEPLRFPVRSQRWLMVVGAVFLAFVASVGLVMVWSHLVIVGIALCVVGGVPLVMTLILLVRTGAVLEIVVDGQLLVVPARLGGAPRVIPRSTIQQIQRLIPSFSQSDGHLPRLRIDWDEDGTRRHVLIDNEVMRTEDFDDLEEALKR